MGDDNFMESFLGVMCVKGYSEYSIRIGRGNFEAVVSIPILVTPWALE
jgi:hypothetical protein